jgi:predicted RNA-binding Zn-ribbon protein involved in translation (DUF1610 family)
MTVCFCSECGARVPTRSEFERFFCPECGAEDTLAAADAYDGEPDELVCGNCGYRGSGGGGGADSGRLTVDDRCPRCGREMLTTRERMRAGQGALQVRAEPEYSIARAAARRLLEDHWTGELPVDVKRVAAAVGLRVEGGYFAHEGLLVGGKDVIQVPEQESRAAQRFAIAHEIGHRELRHKVNEDKIEPEANTFASELLVPRERMRRAVTVAGYTMGQLCELFDVSAQVITYALNDAKLLKKVRA